MIARHLRQIDFTNFYEVVFGPSKVGDFALFNCCLIKQADKANDDKKT